MDCIFCKIIAGELPAHKVYEDEDVLAFLDIKPVNPGHTLVIPKKHSESLLDTDDATLARVVAACKKIARAIMNATGSPAFNLGVNNGEAAGQVVFHLHFHIMPRLATDKFQLWRGRPYAQGEAEEVAEKIRQKLAG